MSDSDDRALIEHIIDEDDATSMNTAECAGNGRLQGWLAGLKPRQQLIVERRYGLNGEAVHSLAEIAVDLGISRERVRQIQEDALKRLRQLSSQDQAG